MLSFQRGNCITDLIIVAHEKIRVLSGLLALDPNLKGRKLQVQRQRVRPLRPILPISPLDHASRTPLHSPHNYSVLFSPPTLLKRSLRLPRPSLLLCQSFLRGRPHRPVQISHSVRFHDLHPRLEKARVGSLRAMPSHKFRVRLHCSHAQLVWFLGYLRSSALVLHL
jgi:hypothetical protein